MTAPLKILLVDDDFAMQRLLRKWLEMAGYRVTTANDGHDAQQRIVDECPQLLITDWDMPNIDGLGLCEWLRKQKTQNYIYTIFLTSRSASQDMITALETGADDFIKKPVDKGELLARVRSAARVLALESRLRILARTDPLTGLMTRRTFFEVVEREWVRSDRHLFPLSCVMIDIDYFKRINDTYGHIAGDHALRSLATILQQNCRASDSIGRYGGEEFCVLLPETTEEHAFNWAERVRQTIASARGMVHDTDLSITASFGVAQRLPATRTPEEFIDHADQSLLMAKRSGRDRVIGFQSVHRNGQIPTGPVGPAAILEDKTASDIMMTNIVGLKEADAVGRAVRCFQRFHCNSTPVVNYDGKLVGVLSERDIVSIMFLPNWWRTPIKDVMSRNAISYEEDTPVLLIYEFLSRVSMHGVFIVRDGRPVGMISRTGLIRWYTKLCGLNSSALDTVEPSFETRPVIEISPQSNLTSLAHAIMTEVGSIEQCLGRLQSETDPIVTGSISRIEALISNLLSYSHDGDSGRDEFPIEPNSPADCPAGVAVL